MMELKFYDPGIPPVNDYLTNIYFDALRHFCFDKGIGIELISDLSSVKNSIVLLNASWLVDGIITKLKENGNTIVSFDINDNSVFTSVVPEAELNDIDLIFKIAGIQKTESSFEMMIDRELNYTREKQLFMGGNHKKYFEVIASNKVKALPHVPWGFRPVENIKWAERKQKAIVRGGHHYQRVHLLFQLLSKGLADGFSMFPGSMYFDHYCNDCKEALKNEGRITLANSKDRPCRLKYWTEGFNENGSWNNQCIPRYYDLAVIFNEKYGGVDIDLVQNIFNGKFITNWFDTILNRYMFYADMKWIFSIYTPPRFWEAAGAHTINLSPERLNDQEQFPAIKDGVHYLSYKEDFSNIKEVIEGITQEQFEFITQNCFAIYKEWILPNKYSISDKLLQYIIDGIERSVQ